MTLEAPPVAYVWIWLPGQREPVVAGRLDADGPRARFTYGRSYRSRPEAIALYLPELPLVAGPQEPTHGPIAGCLADAGPDAWGRRVIDRRLSTANRSPGHDLTDLAYLLESGSDRIGALDFQRSADVYVPRGEGESSLEDLLAAAERVEAGEPVDPALAAALWHGTSIGGARPKALLREGDRSLIAKFGASTDDFPNVKGELVAMELARRSGLSVAPVQLTSAAGRDVLLVERFDRPGDGTRCALVSARTMLGLGEWGIGASYAELADLVRARFHDATSTLEELFGRLVFNILCGNTDDHARNHAAFWDGLHLALTPAYDISPERRPSWEANQAMAIGHDGFRASQVRACVERAATYHLTEVGARAVIDRQIATIEDEWDDACELAELTDPDAKRLRERQFLHPYALEGYPR